MQVVVKELKFEEGGTIHADVFWGEGWYNWSRVRIENTPGQRPNFHHVSGFGLPWNVRSAVIRQMRIG